MKTSNATREDLIAISGMGRGLAVCASAPGWVTNTQAAVRVSPDTMKGLAVAELTDLVPMKLAFAMKRWPSGKSYGRLVVRGAHDLDDVAEMVFKSASYGEFHANALYANLVRGLACEIIAAPRPSVMRITDPMIVGKKDGEVVAIIMPRVCGGSRIAEYGAEWTTRLVRKAPGSSRRKSAHANGDGGKP